MEIIREVKVTIVVVNTDGEPRSRKLVLGDDETLAEFKRRVDEAVSQLTLTE